MKRLFLLGAVITVFLMSPFFTQAQSKGDIALGLRPSPDGAGITAKFFLDHNFAIETQLNGGFFQGSSVALVGMLEYHLYLPAPGWRLYFGGGIHFGQWDRYDDNDPQGIFGIDGIFGVEYQFRTIPLGLSADVKPAMNFASEVAFFPNNSFGIAGRFYFGRPHGHAPAHQRP